MNLTEFLPDLRDCVGWEKEEFIKKLSQDKDWETYRRIIAYTLNPYITFGIAKDNAPEGRKDIDIYGLEAFFSLLHKLANRKITGRVAEASLHVALEQYNSVSQDLLRCIYKKDFRAGVGAKTVNKAIPGLIPTFNVMLGEPYKDDKHKIAYPVRVEPKIDGVRCVAIVQNNIIKLFTRQGKELDMPHIIKQLKFLKGITPEIVLDGELWHPKGFQTLMQYVKSKYSSAQAKELIHYTVFNWIDKVKFERGDVQLKPVPDVLSINADNVNTIGYRIAQNEDELMKCYDAYCHAGFEGVMIKTYKPYYKPTRSSSWLKLKPILETTGIIRSVNPGDGRLSNTMGDITVEVQVGGHPILNGVGTGFSDAERDQIWNSREALLGREVEIEYQELTNIGKLRFPRFKRFVGGE